MLSRIPRPSNTDALHIVVVWRPGNENQLRYTFKAPEKFAGIIKYLFVLYHI